MMTEEQIYNMKRELNSVSGAVTRDVEKMICSWLNQCGLFYKIFSRVKKGDSVEDKLRRKWVEYGAQYKMQDLVGVRIVLYFKEDISLCEKIIDNHLDVIEVVHDNKGNQNFGPQRINYVCKMPEELLIHFESDIWTYPFDKTFEIQLRTVFSEGWHEVEHDFRYKYKEEWIQHEELARALNGVFATLENCDWTIANILNKMAYQNYKDKSWVSMLRNKLQIRIHDTRGMERIIAYFDENPEVAKDFYRLDRQEFLLALSNLKRGVPLTMLNVVFLLNLWEIKDSKILEMTPALLQNLM